MPGSSLVVRGGYGIYRNQSVYQSIAMLLAQQPPLSTTASAADVRGAAADAGDRLSDACRRRRSTRSRVDPAFRVGSAHNWQASVQRDLPSSLTVIATYLGSRGTHLMQEFLPNTYPVGAVNPCPTCPSGFVYLTSNGTSLRNAGQVQLRRRLRNGFTASGQYTLAKATDNATAFGGASLAGSAIAQDWRDLDAEQAPSNFDQRHQFTAQAQYTTGAGITRRHARGRPQGAPAEGLDLRHAVHHRQRHAAHARVPGAGARHRLRRQRARTPAWATPATCRTATI